MKNQFTLLFTFILTLFTTNIIAQGEGNNWYFGNKAGLNFETNPPTILNNSQMITLEGCASISNQAGDLLFYTDGTFVWNKDHQIMPNGTGLQGASSSTQSSVVVPHPGDPNLYYIFTTDTRNNNLGNGFNYSMVDLSLDDGFGDVIPVDGSNVYKRLIPGVKVPEKVTAVKHGNEPAYWIITHGWGENTFNDTYYVFKIDQSGLIETPTIYNIGSSHQSFGGNDDRALGYLKASPDGTLMAAAIGDMSTLDLFDFNDMTGEISNFRSVGTGFSQPYGIEFSPDGTKMYATSLANNKKIQQIDLANAYSTYDLNFTAGGNRYCGALQISPHGIIYMATGTVNSGQQNLPAILNPDEAEDACNLVDNYQSLGTGRVHYGLPTFIQSFFLAPSFTVENTCLNDTTIFTLEIELQEGQEMDSVIWNFGDTGSGADNIFYTLDSTVNGTWEATHVFTSRGAFNVNVEIVLVGGFSFSNNQSVTIDPLPDFYITDLAGNTNPPDTFRLCFGETMRFKVNQWGFANATWNNNSAGQVSSLYSSSGDVSVEVINAQGCSATDTTYLDVRPEANIVWTIPDFCEGDSPIIINDSIEPTGGVFTSDAVTFVDPDYILDPALIPVGGTQPLFYDYTDPYNCVTDEVISVRLYEKPDVALTLSDNSLCEDTSVITLDGGSPLGGDYIYDDVVVTTFDPETEGVGPHEIRYGYTNADGCSDTATTNIQVNALPDVIFNPVDNICQNTGVFIIDEGEPAGVGGTYTGDQVDALGDFDTNTLPGDYDLIYEYEDENGCSDTAHRTVTVIQEPQEATSASVNNNAYCIANQPAEIILDCVGPDNSYVWYANDTTTAPIGNTKTLTVPAPSVTTEYLVRSETSCGNSDAISVTVTVYASPVADFGLANVCEDEAAVFTDNSSVSAGTIDSWEWDFGDGASANISDPSHTYTTYGTNTVTLTVTTDNNCQSSVDYDIEVYDNPTSSFDFTSACLGESTSFSSTSTAPVSTITQWDWQIESSHYLTENATHTFSNDGSFNVELLVETEHGCQNSITQAVSVNPLPLASFDHYNPCRSNVVELTNTSAPSGAGGSPLETFLWDFNNGETSDQFELTYIYPAAGIYDVDLTVTDQNGCSDTITENDVTVSPDFDVSITSDPFCIDVEGIFDGEPVPDFLPMDDYEWLLPDGSTVHGEDIPHTFTSAGTYQIGLVGTLGTCTAGKTYEVVVKELPTPGFEYTGQCLKENIVFNDTSSGDGLSLTSWSWDFGDGNFSTLQNPTHSYVNTGNYPINLTITDANGCENSAVQNISFRNLPKSSFTPALPWCEGTNISFNNNSTTPGTITDYFWNMGDGSTYTTEDVIHAYSIGGDQTISLIVTDELNCKDTSEQSLYITPEFTLNIAAWNLCSNATTSLTGEVVSPVLAPDSWNWLFEDGSTASGQNTTYTFGSGGAHTVQLSATKNGCTETHNQILSVDPAPTANFQYSLVSLDDTVQFQDISTTNGGPAIVAWDWNFGDPMSGLDNFSTLQNPEHLFSHLGDFDVTLTVTDANGCSDDTTMTLTVNPRPVAGFMWDSSCFGTDVQFIDTSYTSQGFITDWWWNFGDPASGAFNQSTAQNPTHAFTAPGIYNVQLVVKAYGYDTIVHQVEVFEGAVADFSFNTPCQGEAVNFMDESTIGAAPIESWFWDFADGNTSTDQNPSHVYQFSGNYLVDLTVTDTNGCSATVTKNVTIWQGPTAKFNHYSACVGSLTYFIDKTIADGADIVSWDWSFGDPASGGLNFSQLQNPSHEYSAPGTYQVILIAEDANGCTDSDTVNIVVEPAPVADFIADSVCFGESMTFVDQSYSSGQPITSWYWEFGDGATSTIANPTHSYTAPGNYDVLLVVETAGGCSNEIVKTVKVHYLPVADFEWSSGMACENDTTQFTDLSAPVGNATIDSWLWQFGDGASSTEQHPAHFYENAGSYAVNLLVTDINGCQNSITQTVIVSQAPVSNFIFDNSDCDSVAFTSTGYDPNGLNITSWYWNFDDPGSGSNNISTGQNPYHQYVNGGTYNVMHIITNEDGCVDTTFQEVIISKPQANFSFTSSCAGLPINFTDESVATGDPVVSWLWNFNDGSTSTQQNPSHIFTSGGSYLVSLTVTTAGGCSSQISYLVDVNYGPTANFTYTSIHCTGDSIQFTDVSTGNAPIVTWEWQMGDGTVYSTQNVMHAYAAPGTYLVNLRVTDQNGCYKDKTETISIDQSPTANFNWDIVNCDTTFFTDFSNPNGTNLIAWTWQFDDPASGAQNISFAQNPNHKFTAAGLYNVQLTVSNQHLCADTLTRVVAYDAQPGSDFTFDTVCYGDTTHFTDLTPTDFQTIQSWQWNFGDGVTSFEQNPNHKYNAPGIYQVVLKVINSNFCEDSIVKQVLVRELPIVAFIPDSSCFGAPVNFMDQSIANADSIVSWNWDFGDGAASNLSDPSHSYATDGTYPVTLTVENNFGCSNTATQPHYVNPLPIVDFIFDSVCLGNITQFTNLSSSPLGIESYFWDFDDGSTSVAANPTHTYTTFGSFDVTLIVTDFMGCVDSVEKTVTVHENPIVSFDAPAVCLGDSTYFTDLTTPPGAIWNWSFGDGASSTEQNPAHLYANSGTYTVLFEVETAGGCSNSVVQEVEVYSLPIVDFSWNFAACAGDTVFFEDLSQGVGTDIINWNWDFGDGASSVEQNPKHIYAESNDTTYNVTLIIETGTGCIDSLTQVVNITGAPMADFSFSNTENNGPCVNNQFIFNDLSTTQSGLIQEWLWDFGDGATSNSQNPIHFFSTADTFDVSLTVVNTAGCDNTVVIPVIVLDLPIVDFSFDSVCLGDTTFFNDSDFINLTATAQWDYTFGDGSSDTLSDPSHLYISPGTYNVILQITDTNLCRNQITHEVPVYGLPEVDFTFDTACLFEETHYTDLTSTADHDLANWSWSFGDGASSTDQNPIYTFTDFGTFNTKLVVSDAWGCTDSLTKLVRVYEPPVANFNFSDTSCTNGLIHFTDSSYHNQGHSITDFLWTMDEYETDEQNPVYIFPETELAYPVSLMVTDVRGCMDTIVEDIFVEPELEVSFSADTVCFGQQTMLIAYTTKPDNANVRQWTWYFDDGTPQVTTPDDTIYHTFAADGEFRVELQANQMGTQCVAEAMKNVKVRPLPMADFLAESAACADSTFFLEESIGSESSIEQWRWYFGDGNTQVINTPDNPDTKHLYPPFLNTYLASLAVTDEFGCTDSISHNVQRYPCIYVNFITDTNIYCQSKAVTLIDSSIVSEESTILTRYWNFGDGIELTTGPDTDTVTHIYEQTGTYEITYIINFDVNGDPISDTARKTITVYPTPIAAISAENVCDQKEALLISNTAANNSIVNNWTWYFGDGTDTTVLNNEVNNAVHHTYPQAGAYDLSLVAVTDLGCRDTAFRNFIVNPVPQIGFMADTTEICGPNSILFTDTSQMESGAIVRRAWSFGDFTDAIASEDTISHYYELDPEALEGYNYTITLTAITDSACRATDSIVDMIAQYALPRPAFRVDPDSIAITELETMILTNESENAYYFEWFMADSILYTDNFEPNIWEDIQDTGHYKLQLYAQTVEGCWDSTESYFKVYPEFRFFIPNAFSPNGNGVNEYFGPKGKYFDDKSYSMRIFNRWGKQVFETNDFYTQWDGRSLETGELEQIGVYAWVIEVTDLQGNIEKFSGFVTLIL